MSEGLIFGDISNFDIKIKKEDIELFMKVINDQSVPNEFVMQTHEGVFIVNKKKKSLKIFERRYQNQKLTKNQIDLSTFIVSKIAVKCGFSITLDVKYSN